MKKLEITRFLTQFIKNKHYFLFPAIAKLNAPDKHPVTFTANNKAGNNDF